MVGRTAARTHGADRSGRAANRADHADGSDKEFHVGPQSLHRVPPTPGVVETSCGHPVGKQVPRQCGRPDYRRGQPGPPVEQRARIADQYRMQQRQQRQGEAAALCHDRADGADRENCGPPGSRPGGECRP